MHWPEHISDGAWGTVSAIAAAVITGIFTLLGIRKKRLSETSVVKAIDKDSDIGGVLDRIDSEFDECQLCSIVAITNHDTPVNHQVLYSTDIDTKAIWNVPESVEDALAKALGTVAKYGFNNLFPDQIENPKTLDWYADRRVEMTMIFSIGVGEFAINGKREQAWIILFVNWNNHKHPPSSTMMRLHLYVSELRQVFKNKAKRKKLITS